MSSLGRMGVRYFRVLVLLLGRVRKVTTLVTRPLVALKCCNVRIYWLRVVPRYFEMQHETNPVLLDSGSRVGKGVAENRTGPRVVESEGSHKSYFFTFTHPPREMRGSWSVWKHLVMTDECHCSRTFLQEKSILTFPPTIFLSYPPMTNQHDERLPNGLTLSDVSGTAQLSWIRTKRGVIMDQSSTLPLPVHQKKFSIRLRQVNLGHNYKVTGRIVAVRAQCRKCSGNFRCTKERGQRRKLTTFFARELLSRKKTRHLTIWPFVPRGISRFHFHLGECIKALIKRASSWGNGVMNMWGKLMK